MSDDPLSPAEVVEIVEAMAARYPGFRSDFEDLGRRMLDPEHLARVEAWELERQRQAEIDDKLLPGLQAAIAEMAAADAVLLADLDDDDFAALLAEAGDDGLAEILADLNAQDEERLRLALEDWSPAAPEPAPVRRPRSGRASTARRRRRA